VVVRSRPAAYVKENGWSTRVTAALMRGTPTVAAAMLRTAERYQRAVAMLHAPPPDCQVLHVAPTTPMRTSRTTRAHAALEHDYQHGRAKGEEAIAAWGR
jgi:predicted patatin/cPLA2 family phospholipase